MPGLEDLYREIILDHYRNPRNRGELPRRRPTGSRGSTRCAATRSSSTSMSTDGTVSDIRIGGQGCSISQSSASMMSAAVKGKTVDEARALIRAFKAMMSIHEQALDGDDGDGDDRPRRPPRCKLGDLEALQGVVKFPVRIKCATLSWNTLSPGPRRGRRPRRRLSRPSRRANGRLSHLQRNELAETGGPPAARVVRRT